MGLGHFGGGVAAARWLARQGAVVTVTDTADEDALAESLASLEDVSIDRFRLGGHAEEDFRTADLIVVNPAVRPGNRLLEIARRGGARLSSEIELFLEACPVPVVGVTGSNGKSTTAAMIAAMIEADGRRAWLGGNIGHSLLDDLPRITADDWAVLELSSFQLWHLSSTARMPQVGVVTGCSPNHLDWHGNYEDYIAAKQRILTCQTAVLNTHDAEVASWRPMVTGRLCGPVPLADIPPLRVPGRHNRIDAACAAAAVAAVGCAASAVCNGLESFAGLSLRLEQMATIDGRTFYNDSTATTPESTVAALQSLDRPVWLLAGGADKGCDLAKLTAAAAENAQGVAFYGAVRRALHDGLIAANSDVPCTAVETMADALDWCWQGSRPGDAVVLSPGCSSHDQFRDFRHRGEHFVELVHALGKPS